MSVERWRDCTHRPEWECEERGLNEVPSPIPTLAAQKVLAQENLPRAMLTVCEGWGAKEADEAEVA